MEIKTAIQMPMRNNRHTQMFLDRLNWRTNSGEIKEIDSFQIDVYQFCFRPSLAKEHMTDFTEYVQSLNMGELRSVMKIWIWLYQHDIKFKIRFGYNVSRSLKYNLKNLLWPARINWLLLQCEHDDLMSCPLDTMK